MLPELVKRDSVWRRMAFQICKSKDTADDLVQEMYLYFSDKEKTVTDWYIFKTMKDIFLHQVNKSKRHISIGDFQIIDDCSDYDVKRDTVCEIVIEEIKNLPFYERELLNITMEMSQRALSKETGISLKSINKTIVSTKKKVWKIAIQKAGESGML
ncbi:sigma-70 family RNA polymerase sigma factor [Flavobacterium kingsejongi]|uniref:RNA polymerase sigma-70 region 2 domain-containing protein n=1 Tax=Flavobacterium kingsejongi TaxID=1678728 RepID=A0A2S1LQK9_9FLAO|nr:sigma-70 family RNA polymerase sigma factor [Flavobacterium kingsejongi]AWG26009.1 hypothetical protein FK004_12635 [Flavobacterium kingsejongi]